MIIHANNWVLIHKHNYLIQNCTNIVSSEHGSVVEGCRCRLYTQNTVFDQPSIYIFSFRILPT
jgi:hypothetical protein